MTSQRAAVGESRRLRKWERGKVEKDRDTGKRAKSLSVRRRENGTSERKGGKRRETDPCGCCCPESC